MLTLITLLQNFLYLTAMQLSSRTKQILLSLLCLVVFLGVYSSLTNSTVYNVTLGNVVKPYKGIDTVVVGGGKVNEPYTPITKKHLQQWDARTYYQIGEYGYSQYYTTAFFPLFPLVYKLTGFSWFIIIINFLLFALSLAYIFRLIGSNAVKSNSLYMLLLLAMPSVFVFFMPYSEALFFFCFTLCIAGFLKGNKYLLFAGLLLAAATRPIVTIVLLSILSAEFIRFLQTRNLKAALYSLGLFLFPMLLGTSIAVYVQYSYTGHVWDFITVQDKVWQHTFRLPTKVADWSDEGHTLNIFSILFIVFPALFYCVGIFIQSVKNKGRHFTAHQILQAPAAEKLNYLVILSAAYTVGSFCFILFFQGGSLNGTFRYIMCTPFFYILLLVLLNKVQAQKQVSTTKHLKIIAALSALFILWIGVYKQRLINMVEIGFILLLATLLLFVLYNIIPRRVWNALAAIVAFLGLVYQTYLFNSFLANSWILT